MDATHVELRADILQSHSRFPHLPHSRDILAFNFREGISFSTDERLVINAVVDILHPRCPTEMGGVHAAKVTVAA